MPEQPRRRNGSGAQGIVVLGVAVLAIGCCAGVPLIAALAGSVAAGTLLGAGAGLIVAVALVGVIALRVRARRGACETPVSQQHPPSQHRSASQRRSAVSRHH